MQLDKKYISLLYEVQFECEKIHSESISDNIWRIRTDLNLQVCSTGLSDIGIFQNTIFRYWYFQILVFSDIGLSDIGIFSVLDTAWMLKRYFEGQDELEVRIWGNSNRLFAINNF